MEFLHTDIVVYCGVISSWGAIKHFCVLEEVMVADEIEISWFHYMQKKYV
jgi:hypothetical protein